MTAPIPHRELPGEPTAYQYIESELVSVAEESDIRIKMMYPILGMKNATDKCLVRREVLDRLMLAQKALPEGYYLTIWDAWRPFALQKELYLRYSGDILRMFRLENAPEEEQKKAVSRYVSYPEFSGDIVPVHTTGGAVDLTLTDADGHEIEMGTAFDAFSELTAPDWFETHPGDTVRENRRILYRAMTEAGFTNLPSEWWHYDYGDRFWAYYTDSAVLYKGIYDIQK